MSGGVSNWGAVWLDAVSTEIGIDSLALARGRGLVGRGAVAELEVEPSSARAVVAGRGAEPDRVQIGVRRFTPQQWASTTEAIADSRRSVLAVLDGHLPQALVDVLAERGCNLIPGRGDVSIDCGCGNTAGTCAHAGALCWALAELIDADPLLLMTLRGGDRVGLVASVRSGVGGANGESSNGWVAPIAGRPPVVATSASSLWRRRLGPLPEIDHRRLVARPPRSVAQPPPAELGFDQRGLDRLAVDASRRAVAALREDASTGLELDVLTDAVRRVAAGLLGVDELAVASGRSSDDAAALVDAWRAVGGAGVQAILQQRRLTAAEMAEVCDVWGEGVRERSTGALLPDGRQVRRTDALEWVIVEFVEPRGWRAVASSKILEELAGE